MKNKILELEDIKSYSFNVHQELYHLTLYFNKNLNTSHYTGDTFEYLFRNNDEQSAIVFKTITFPNKSEFLHMNRSILDRF